MLQLPHFLLGKMNGGRAKERLQNMIKVEDEKSQLGELGFNLYYTFLGGFQKMTKTYIIYLFDTKSTGSISDAKIHSHKTLLTKTKCSLTDNSQPSHAKEVPFAHGKVSR